MANNIANTVTGAINTANAAVGLVNAGTTIADALSNASADNIASILRGCVIPVGAEAIGNTISALASFSGEGDDWRVRLSMPTWTSFRSSPALKPLMKAGGLVFPYTPQVTIDQSAKYSTVSPIHSNYSFQAFQSSDPGKIQITAPMFVEDAEQGQYWIGMLHYLRAITKMFSGSDPKAGNPPPVVFLNGYGSYVFKNIPVVVTSFRVTLGNETDYITCEVGSSLLGAVADIAESISGFASEFGNIMDNATEMSLVTDMSNTVRDAADVTSAIAGTLGSFGLGGTLGGEKIHVPIKSSFEVTLQPVYSRDSVKNFSLDKFLIGGYLNNEFGRIFGHI